MESSREELAVGWGSVGGDEEGDNGSLMGDRAEGGRSEVREVRLRAISL